MKTQICFTKSTSKEYKLQYIFNLLNKKVKIDLNGRSIYGMLVSCNDFGELVKKGMVRFVINERVEKFQEDQKTMHTRIFNYNDFLIITEYEN